MPTTSHPYSQSQNGFKICPDLRLSQQATAAALPWDQRADQIWLAQRLEKGTALAGAVAAR
jgi:hypothetical protein